MRLASTLCAAAALSWATVSYASETHFSGTVSGDTGPFFLTIDDVPDQPTTFTMFADVELAFPIIIQPRPDSVLPIRVPLVIDMFIGSQTFEATSIWLAALSDYESPDVTAIFTGSFTASGPLDVSGTGGFCTDICPPAQGSWDVIWGGDSSALTINGSLTYDSIPEPAGLALLGTGVLGLGVIRKRRT